MEQKSSGHMSLYKALDVPVTATYYQIRKAFHRIARKMSPDKHLNHPNWPAINEKFAYLIFAYEILKDPDTRVIYDARGFHGLRSIGVSIPAGFQDSPKQSTACPNPMRDKELRLEKETKDNVKRRQSQNDEMLKMTDKTRRQKEPKEMFHFAVYKQVIKIAWKKELMNERERENLRTR